MQGGILERDLPLGDASVSFICRQYQGVQREILQQTRFQQRPQYVVSSVSFAHLPAKEEVQVSIVVPEPEAISQ